LEQPWIIVCTLGAVFFIFAYIRYRSSEQAAKRKELAELEESFDQLAREIEEDNRKVLRYVSEYKEKHDQQTRILKSRIDMLEKELMALKARGEDDHDSSSAASVVSGAAVSGAIAGGDRPEAPAGIPSPAAPQASYPDPNPPRPGGDRIAERYKAVLDLYRSGKSIESIARKTNMPKGEIQLILQLAEKQEEAYRAQG